MRLHPDQRGRHRRGPGSSDAGGRNHVRPGSGGGAPAGSCTTILGSGLGITAISSVAGTHGTDGGGSGSGGGGTADEVPEACGTSTRAGGTGGTINGGTGSEGKDGCVVVSLSAPTIG